MHWDNNFILKNFSSVSVKELVINNVTNMKNNNFFLIFFQKVLAFLFVIWYILVL
jgi:hypothetical protein